MPGSHPAPPPPEKRTPCDWRENFIQYREDSDYYIYCDTNASYASIHQHLEDGFGKECIVANGNKKDAGACLAISYEARAKGLQRGISLRQALAIEKNLTVYESCLPLYELYAELYDLVLEWIVPRPMFYRGSCDEVVICFRNGQYPYRSFPLVVEQTIEYIQEQCQHEVSLRISQEQKAQILSLGKKNQTLYAICYLVRDCIRDILGLPISIAVSPSIALSKSLIDHAKPKVINGQRCYRTFHDAIAFPQTRDEANALFRPHLLRDLCGVHEIARRLESHGIKTVGHVQDQCSFERTLLLARNAHLGKVVWFMSHGRDDVLSGYLSAIRDRK